MMFLELHHHHPQTSGGITAIKQTHTRTRGVPGPGAAMLVAMTMMKIEQSCSDGADGADKDVFGVLTPV